MVPARISGLYAFITAHTVWVNITRDTKGGWMPVYIPSNIDSNTNSSKYLGFLFNNLGIYGACPCALGKSISQPLDQQRGNCGHHAIQLKSFIVCAGVWTLSLLFSVWIRATLQPPQLLQRQMIVMRMSYPGAASAMKMPLCAAMAVTGTSIASAVFGESHNSSRPEKGVKGKAPFVCFSHWAGKQGVGGKIWGIQIWTEC